MRIDPVLVLIPALALAGATAAHAQQAPSASAAGLRMLSWPGKVAAPAPRRAQAPTASGQVASAAVQPRRPDPAWRPAYRPVPHGNSHMLGDLTPAQAAQVQAQRQQAAADAERARVQAQVEIQLQAQQQARQAQPAPALRQAAAPLPTSIFAPAPPPAGQIQVAQAPRQAAPQQRIAAASAYDQKAHFYSLHRQYGQSPDPVTLSPQFLSSPSADLADPPPPPPPRLTPNANAGQQTAARVAQRDSSSD